MSQKAIISVGVAIIIAVIAYFIIQNQNSETTDSSSSLRQMISDGPVIITRRYRFGSRGKSGYVGKSCRLRN
jgi:hypothetical protein